MIYYCCHNDIIFDHGHDHMKMKIQEARNNHHPGILTTGRQPNKKPQPPY